MGRALGIILAIAPFISALLLGLGWAGRALHHRLARKTPQ